MRVQELTTKFQAHLINIPEIILGDDKELLNLLQEVVPRLELFGLKKFLAELKKKEVPHERAVKLLGIKAPKGSDWYEGENGILERINLWAESKAPELYKRFEEKKQREIEAEKEKIALALEEEKKAQTLREATLAALVACTEEKPKEESKIPKDAVVHHARKMLEEVNVTIPDSDEEIWALWEKERDKWSITAHVFNSESQPDFFNSSKHVKNILTVKHSELNTEVIMGPDDAKGIFTNKKTEIDLMVHEKFQIRKSYQRKANEILKLISLFDDSEKEKIKEDLERFKKDVENIGDKELKLIDRYYTELEKKWILKTASEHSLSNFLKAIENIQRVINDLAERGDATDLGKFTDDINKINETRIIPKFLGGELPTEKNKDDIDLLVNTYKKLKNFQKERQVVFGKLAKGKRVSEPLDKIYGTHRGQAGLLTLAFLNNILRTPKNILDFMGNGVLHTISNQLPGNVHNIVDLERVSDINLYSENPNPKKLLADFSNILQPGVRTVFTSTSEPTLPDEKYGAVSLNFILNHLEPDEIKKVLAASSDLLVLSSVQNQSTSVSSGKDLDVQSIGSSRVFLSESNISNFPLLIINLPNRYEFENSSLYEVLKASGFSPYMQVDGVNELEENISEEIRCERGKDIATGVKSRVHQPYKMHVFALTEPRDLKYLPLIDEDKFDLNDTEMESATRGKHNGDDEGKLNVDRIQKEIATGNLRAINFRLPSVKTISASEIVNGEKYKDFEKKLATLMEFKLLLDEKEKTTLNQILKLWDFDFVSSLSETQVAFVMQKPETLRFPQSQFPYGIPFPSIGKGSYSLWEVCKLLEEKRKKSLLEKHRGDSLSEKIKKVAKTKWEFVLKDLKNYTQTLADPKMIMTEDAGDKLIAIFRGHGVAVKMFGSDNPNPALLYQEGVDINVNIPGINLKFIIGIGSVIPASSLRLHIPHRTSITERIEIFQANSGFTDAGMQLYMVPSSLTLVGDRFRTSSQIIESLKGVRRKTLDLQTRNLLSIIFQAEPDDFLPKPTVQEEKSTL